MKKALLLRTAIGTKNVGNRKEEYENNPQEDCYVAQKIGQIYDVME